MSENGRHCDKQYCKDFQQGPLLLTWINFDPSWISNYIHHKEWNEMNNPFLNFSGANSTELQPVSDANSAELQSVPEILILSNR